MSKLNEQLDQLAQRAQSLVVKAEQVNLFIQAVQNRLVGTKFRIPVWIDFEDGRLGFDKAFSSNDWRLLVRGVEQGDEPLGNVELLSAPIRTRALAAVKLPALVELILARAGEIDMLLSTSPSLEGLTRPQQNPTVESPALKQAAEVVKQIMGPRAVPTPVASTSAAIKRFGSCSEEGRGPAPAPDPDMMPDRDPDARHVRHEMGGGGIPVTPRRR